MQESVGLVRAECGWGRELFLDSVHHDRVHVGVLVHNPLGVLGLLVELDAEPIILVYAVG